MRRVKPISLMIAVLFAGPAVAADDPVGSAWLKLDRSMQLQFKPGDDNGAVFLDADRIETPAVGELFAVGKAQLRRRGVYVFADELRYWSEDERIHAKGQRG